MEDKEAPGDWDLVTAYKRLWNSEEGEVVLRHLKQVCRYDDWIFDYDMSEERMRAMHYTSRIVNFIEYMRTREKKQAPEEKLDFLEITNEL